jgi:membrane protein DedA with SNARE-associated domain
MLESLIIRWGYLAIAFGIFLEGESVLILGGALAQRGLLSLPLVMLTAFLSAFAGDQFWFHMGRRYGRPLLSNRPKWLARIGAVNTRLQRYGDVFVFGFRFIYGIRTVTPALLGMSEYPRSRFVVLNFAGVAVWSVAISYAGWALGAAFQQIMDRAVHVQKIVGGVLAAALVVWLAYVFIRRRLRKQDPHEL